jgi:hypothetical protein
MDSTIPEFGSLLERRLLLLHHLAESLEFSRLALARNDAEAIARGATHQTELCRRWALLEEQLRNRVVESSGLELAPEHSADLARRWNALEERIRYSTRVHCSLLRHMQRSLAVLNHLMNSAAPTYAPISLSQSVVQQQTGE